METLVWGDARNPNKPYPKRVGICEISTARQDVVTATRLSVCTVLFVLSTRQGHLSSGVSE